MSEICQQSKSTSGGHYFVCRNHGLACHWCGETKNTEPTLTHADVLLLNKVAIRADREKLIVLIEKNICSKVHDDFHIQYGCDSEKARSKAIIYELRNMPIGGSDE